MKIKSIKIILLILIMIIAYNSISFSQNNEEDEELKRVLLISSYSPSFNTFFQQIDGIKSEFEGKNIQFDIEFMDSKRLYTEDNISNFYNSIKYKLSNLETYDAIIVSDDNALVFVMEHKDELFPEIPIVFLGINNLENAATFSKDPYVTGYIENISIEETILVANQINKNANRVVAITDNTFSGQSDLKRFYKESGKFSHLEFKDIDLSNLSFFEFALELQKLKDTDIILLLSIYSDKEGNSVTFNEGLQIILGNVSHPVYHLFYHGLNDGILGGKIVSHYKQGQSAASVVNRIFSGEEVSSISYIKESPNSYIFDYDVLEKYDIKVSLLPPEALIINKPVSFYEENKFIIINSLIIFSLLIVIIIVGSIFLIKSRKTEKKLAESEDRLQLALSGASLGTWDWYIQSDALTVNKRWVEMLGYTEEELKPTKQMWVDLIHPEDKDNVMNILNNHLIGLTDSYEIEFRLHHKLGSWVWVLAKGKVIDKDESGIPIRACGTHLDITERKNTELKLLSQRTELSDANNQLLLHKEHLEDLIFDRTAELETSIADLKSTQDQLIEAEKMASLGGLVAGIAHEINTPVGTSITIASHLGDKTKSIKNAFDKSKLTKSELQAFIDNALESTTMILNNMNRTAGLVNSFKQVATDQSSLNLREFNVKDYVVEVLRSMNSRFKRTKFTIGLDVPEDIVIFNDPGILYQVLSNLLMNSLNHGFKNLDEGSINIQIAQNQNMITLVYSDTGHGISEENIQRIYDPFFTTGRSQGNTGLGMNIIFNSVTQTLKGSIKCDSILGEGTTFTIKFPCDIKQSIS